jgi:hypothetical protein
VETFLREVMIVGQNLRQAFTAHGLHGDATSKWRTVAAAR